MIHVANVCYPSTGSLMFLLFRNKMHTITAFIYDCVTDRESHCFKTGWHILYMWNIIV